MIEPGSIRGRRSAGAGHCCAAPRGAVRASAVQGGEPARPVHQPRSSRWRSSRRRRRATPSRTRPTAWRDRCPRPGAHGNEADVKQYEIQLQDARNKAEAEEGQLQVLTGRWNLVRELKAPRSGLVIASPTPGRGRQAVRPRRHRGRAALLGRRPARLLIRVPVTPARLPAAQGRPDRPRRTRRHRSTSRAAATASSPAAFGRCRRRTPRPCRSS